MDFAVALLGIALGGFGLFLVVCAWIGYRMAVHWGTFERSTNPITGPKDRIAIYDVGGPFIPMPDRLKTHNEMIAWMMHELPKLTVKARGTPH